MKELIERRDQDDPETATTSMKELIDRQDQGAPVIEMTPVRTRPTAHRDPETEATAGMIERVDRPLHLHQPYRLDRDDLDMDSLHSSTAPLEAE